MYTVVYLFSGHTVYAISVMITHNNRKFTLYVTSIVQRVLHKNEIQII